jgi:hypothetical protein
MSDENEHLRDGEKIIRSRMKKGEPVSPEKPSPPPKGRTKLDDDWDDMTWDWMDDDMEEGVATIFLRVMLSVLVLAVVWLIVWVIF